MSRRFRPDRVLQRTWQRAAAGRGQLALITGEPGIGKSRLFEHLVEILGDWSYRTVLMQCSPDLIDSPLHPVISYLNLALDDPGPTGVNRRERFAAWVSEQVDDEPESLALLAALVSPPIELERDPAAALDAEQRRQRTLAALARHIERLSARTPTVMLIEDVHWADPSTREWLRRLAEQIQTLRVLLIVTSRPGFEADWTDASHVRVLSLSRLAPHESETLARSAAATLSSLPDPIVHEIVSRANGNPLFIEEIVRTVVQRPRDQAEARSVPVTLQDSLMSRLDALEFGKAVAQSASAIGRNFEYRLLRGIWDGDPKTLDSGLSELCQEGVIYSRGEDDERSFQFKHALVQDVAYATLLRERRRALHRRVATTIELQRPDVPVTQPELLARHLAAADDGPGAIAMWAAASLRAADRASHEEVIEHCHNALALLATIDASPHIARQRIDFLFRLANSQRILDRSADALDTLDRVQPLLESVERMASEHARMHYMRGGLHFTLGHTEQCEIEHRRALELAREAGVRDIELGALSGLGDAAYASGRMVSAERLYDRMLAACNQYGLLEARPANLAQRADTRSYSGRLTEAIADAEEGRALARAHDDLRGAVLCCAAGVMAFYETGRFAAAAEWARDGAEFARTLGSPNFESFILGFHARILVGNGAAEAARPLAQIAIEHAMRTGPTFCGAMAYSAAALAESSPESALHLLGRGEAILQQECMSHNVLWFCADAIESSLAHRRWEAATRYADLLEQATREEPLPWTNIQIARGRTIARLGAGERTESLANALSELRDRARATELERVHGAVTDALSRFDC